MSPFPRRDYRSTVVAQFHRSGLTQVDLWCAHHLGRANSGHPGVITDSFPDDGDVPAR